MDRSSLETVKVCSKCKNKKSLSEFNKDCTAKDGLQHWCRPCQKQYKKETRKPFIPNSYSLNVTDEFGYWFSGLSDGEAHFGALVSLGEGGWWNLATSFSIGLRIDDIDVLDYIRENLGIGKVLKHHRWKTKTPLQRHQADFSIRKAQQLQEVIIPLFDKYPLRTKKKNDYEIWRKIIMEFGWDGQHGWGVGQPRLTEKQWREAERLCQKLKDVRKFNGD